MNKIVFILCILIASFGCNKKPEATDKFYAKTSITGGFDGVRIPLLAPLFLLSDDGAIWKLEGLDTGIYKKNRNAVRSIKSLSFTDDYFLLRNVGFGSMVEGEIYPDAWYIVDTKMKSITGFIDYNTFQDSLRSVYQIHEIDTLTWRSPKEYFEEFKKERRLEWFPDSLQYE